MRCVESAFVSIHAHTHACTDVAQNVLVVRRWGARSMQSLPTYDTIFSTLCFTLSSILVQLIIVSGDTGVLICPHACCYYAVLSKYLLNVTVMVWNILSQTIPWDLHNWSDMLNCTCNILVCYSYDDHYMLTHILSCGTVTTAWLSYKIEVIKVDTHDKTITNC